ncbi:MAG: archaetidylserine decarboxylase [Spiribacter sp.]|nr:archaetidylserine decarboxylase [Spiribacter sp.]
MLGRLFSMIIGILPQHAISRVVHGLARWRWRPWKNLLIRAFTRAYTVNLNEAASPERSNFESFNAFFTRALAPGAREIATGTHSIVSPVDGEISEFGSIKAGRVIQAKGQDYTTIDLLGGDPRIAQRFANGAFATLYLSPSDYHRVHMPIAGELEQMLHIPGRLFGVSKPLVAHVPRLFARNERVVSLFETAAGPLAVILVGAIGVGSIETVWAGEITPPRGRRIRTWSYPQDPPDFAIGEEMGRFNLGSTVILLWGPETIYWNNNLAVGQPIRMGSAIGQHSGSVPIESDSISD